MNHRGVISLVLVWDCFALQHQCLAFSFSTPSAAVGREKDSIQRMRTRQWQDSGFPSLKESWTAATPRGHGVDELWAHDVDVGVRPAQQQEEDFRWTRQWYPVAVMRDLEARDPRQPYGVQLLGEALVVWKDPVDGGWKAFADRCPHRWAPLSEGRVNQQSGRLHCIYHGWEFDGDGKCGSIPQASPESRAVAQTSNRACATVMPTKVLEGKLWVWPDSSQEGVKESEYVEPCIVRGLDMDSGEYGGQWYARDLPYGADTLVENLIDPAHVPFAHHGVLSARFLGGPLPMELDEEAGSGQDEFLTKGTGYYGTNNLRVGFRAPCLVYYENDYTKMVDSRDKLDALAKRILPPGVHILYRVMKMLGIDKISKIKSQKENGGMQDDTLLLYVIAYAVPTSPGKCRVFTRTARNFFLPHQLLPKGFGNRTAKEHLKQHDVFDGDSHLLHVQERSLADAGELGLERAGQVYYLPTSSDGFVRRFRKWYNSRGGGGPPWVQGADPSDLGPVLPREKTLDRMAHTNDCAACGKAFRVSRAVKRISAGGTLLLLGAATAVPRGLLPLGLASGALASAGLSVAMSRRQQRFVFVDYVHADRD